jgi:chaperonin cofactor prefoldin
MLEQRNSALRGELSTLYKQNRALAAELTSINARLTDQINSRTAAASP